MLRTLGMCYTMLVSRERADALFNLSLVAPIYRSQREIRPNGCIVIKLNTGDPSM